MSIGVIFSITVIFFLISALALVTTSAADLRRAATQKRLQSLRGGSSKSITTEVVEREMAAADPYIALIPKQYRPNFRKMMDSAGHAVNLRALVLAVPISGTLAGIICQFFFHLGFFATVAVGVAAGLLVPFQIIRMAQARMKKQFLALFPDAVDLIVRAIRAGLPISAALDAVGKEMSDPIGKEFRLLVADFKIGMTFEEAMRRAADRVNLLEFSFFTASLILQRETGGNLAETLETLGSVLRRRHEMTLKTNTLTSEARTSAYVMTAMPFFVAGALFFLSPGYLNVYVTDPRGSWILGMALVSLCTGIGIMRIMLSQAMK